MSSADLNLGEMFPQLGSPYTILSNIIEAIQNLTIHITNLFITALRPYGVDSYIEGTRILHKQMLELIPPIDKENYARMNLRMLLGLSPSYKEDPEAIRSLSGSISWMVKEKIDITESISNMRDYE